MGNNFLKAAVVGWPINHSKSPLIHGYWINKFGLSGSYEAIAFRPEVFEQGIRDLVAQGYRGCNVTLPHKATALALADTVADRAQAIGAANTLVFKGGKIIADNTDGIGFINNLKQGAPDWVAGNGPALVLGAGGAARAVVYALLHEGAPSVIIANRTGAKAQSLADFFGGRVRAIGLDQIANVIGEVHSLVNTTSLGMIGQPELDIDISGLPKFAVVTDIVYNPLETRLLEQAKGLGLVTVDGLGMLLHQAVPGFEAWFGVRPSVDAALRRIVLGG
ncbi:MAG: shikimate dehydrogenase [Rhodobacterales bacterium]